MLRKKDMPLAVQRHVAALFNSWCARDFISRGEHEFLGGREEYIDDDVNATWNVLDARYENLVLQFFGENALLTYRNIVKEKDEAHSKSFTCHFRTVRSCCGVLTALPKNGAATDTNRSRCCGLDGNNVAVAGNYTGARIEAIG